MGASLFTPEEFKKNFVKNKKAKKEEKIQLAFCDFVKKDYPDVIFSCDLASGLHLPIHIGALHKRMRSSRAQCDFFAAEPMMEINFCGFFLELKRDRDEVFTKDGRFKKKKSKELVGGVWMEYDHVQEQVEMIRKLRRRGYYADFGLGLEDCIFKFQAYMRKDLSNLFPSFV